MQVRPRTQEQLILLRVSSVSVCVLFLILLRFDGKRRRVQLFGVQFSENFALAHCERSSRISKRREVGLGQRPRNASVSADAARMCDAEQKCGDTDDERARSERR